MLLFKLLLEPLWGLGRLWAIRGEWKHKTYDQVVLEDKPVHYWTFDQDGNWQDRAA